jgi:peptidoglycan/LPS O-acetylase OafA/YrhL
MNSVKSKLFFRRVVEIDALRAIAVLGVVAGHGFGLTGGFIGVDIFFVISGYVITLLMLRQSIGENFSLSKFYYHRIARIIPTLFIVSVFIFFTARFLFLIDEDYSFIKNSYFYQSFFSQNLFFAIQSSDYFDRLASVKLNLHTWSLAVEEQFYIIYPFLFLAVYKFRKNRFFLTFALMGLVLSAFPIVINYDNYIAPSLANWLGVDFTPKTIWATRYYLIFTRAWELFFGVGGCLIAFGMSRRLFWQGFLLPLALVRILTFACLFVIAWSFLYIQESTPWPSAATLPPVFATIIILWILHLHGANGMPFLFKNPILGWVGRSSYSLYLWHWPILGILVYSNNDFGVSKLDYVIYIALTLALTVLTYTLVEKNRSLIRGWQASLILVGFITFSLYVAYSPRYTDNYPQELQQIIKTGAYAGPCTKCVAIPTKPFLILWGDSHAQMLGPAMEEIATSKGLQLVFIRGKLGGDNSDLFKLAQLPQFQGVIMAGRWSMYAIGFPVDEPEETGTRYLVLNGKYPTNKLEAMNSFEIHLESFLSQIPNKTVYIFKEVPRYPFLPVKESAIEWVGLKLRPLPEKTVSSYLEEQKDLTKLFQKAVDKHRNVVLLNATDILCPDNICIWRNGYSIWYKDDDHLSIDGANKIKPVFENAIPNYR